MSADQLSKNNPDGTKLGQSATDLISFFNASPVAQQAITCVAAGCVVATVISHWNTFVKAFRAYGLTS